MDGRKHSETRATEGLTLGMPAGEGRIVAVHGLRGSLALPLRVSAGLPDIKLMLSHLPVTSLSLSLYLSIP